MRSTSVAAPVVAPVVAPHSHAHPSARSAHHASAMGAAPTPAAPLSHLRPGPADVPSLHHVAAAILEYYFPLRTDATLFSARRFVVELVARCAIAAPTLELALLFLVRFRKQLALASSAVTMANVNAASAAAAAAAAGAPLRATSAAPSPSSSTQSSLTPSSSGSPSSCSVVTTTPDQLLIAPACLCGRRMLLAALICATKIQRDHGSVPLRAWARAAGLSAPDLRANEVAFLNRLDHHLWVSRDTWCAWTATLRAWDAPWGMFLLQTETDMELTMEPAALAARTALSATASAAHAPSHDVRAPYAAHGAPASAPVAGPPPPLSSRQPVARSWSHGDYHLTSAQPVAAAAASVPATMPSVRPPAAASHRPLQSQYRQPHPQQSLQQYRLHQTHHTRGPCTMLLSPPASPPPADVAGDTAAAAHAQAHAHAAAGFFAGSAPQHAAVAPSAHVVDAGRQPSQAMRSSAPPGTLAAAAPLSNGGRGQAILHAHGASSLPSGTMGGSRRPHTTTPEDLTSYISSESLDSDRMDALRGIAVGDGLTDDVVRTSKRARKHSHGRGPLALTVWA